MLDPSAPNALELADFATYMSSCQRLVRQRLADCADIELVRRRETELNCYPELERLEEPRQILTLETLASMHDITEQAWRVLEGKVLWEHTCAGEATRLNLGAKYLIVPPHHLAPDVLGRDADLKRPLKVRPDQLAPISLGQRHMLQQAWNIWLLAEGLGQNPQQALARQHLLIIVNSHTADQIFDDFIEADFYGFSRQQVLFMVQNSFPGLIWENERGWHIDPDSPRRLHNHGQMVMQTIMDNQLFYLDANKQPQYWSWRQYQELLRSKTDKVSFNIEDLDFLNQPIDMLGLAACHNLGRKGFQMVMEVVANDPQAPIKGGACYHDPRLGRDVIIESFQLKGMSPEQITHLNRNVNHYPQPWRAMSVLRKRGLSMPLVIKDCHLYFQPVQGDINFIVPTAFVQRAELRPICAWKSGRNTPEALECMQRQEIRHGFLPWARQLTGLSL